MRYVAAFRTYTWDDDVRQLCHRFFSACPSGRHVVLADETRGPLNIQDYEVISHTIDTSYLGLPIYPSSNSLWFNVDYGAYILRNALPNYPYYLLSESDLAVNVDLDPVIRSAQLNSIDVIVHDVKPSTPDWFWHSNGLATFKTPWRSLLFFMVLSARALDTLFHARQRLASEMRHSRMSEWPFCEPFVPSVLKEAGMNFAELSDFVETTNLRFRPRISLDDPRANYPGSLVHSVLGKSSYLKAQLQENPPREWFNSRSELRTALAIYPFSDYAQLLRKAFETSLDHAGLTKFTELMIMQGEEVPYTDDLAFCKPALTSSVSAWSRYNDRQKDASGANGVDFADDYGFHTESEEGPWWMVDLTHESVIDEVRIVNRPNYSERFTTFSIESSLDSNSWSTRHTKLDASEVSSARHQPHRVFFSDPFVARFVRLRLIGTGSLHLRRVEIFGRIVVSRRAFNDHLANTPNQRTPF